MGGKGSIEPMGAIGICTTNKREIVRNRARKRDLGFALRQHCHVLDLIPDAVAKAKGESQGCGKETRGSFERVMPSPVTARSSMLNVTAAMQIAAAIVPAPAVQMR